MLRCLRLAALSLVAGLLLIQVVSAADTAGVRLLRPDSLAGWDHGQPKPRGWTISEGKLSGSGDSTRLLSGWTVGDFELRFDFSVPDGAALVVSFPAVPSGAGLKCELREESSSPAISGSDQPSTAAGNIAKTDGGAHQALIIRAGAKFSLQVDGRQIGLVEVEAPRRFGLALHVSGGKATVSELRLVEPVGGMIFNGQNLDGWWTPGNLAGWKARDGEIVCLNKDGNYLRTEKEFGNFTLSFEYQMSARVNSGVGIRTARHGWPSGDGMELQLEDVPGLNKSSTMAIYGNLEPLARADKPLVWNSAVIKADGRMISGWMNGELVQQVNTARLPELRHRHLQGWIGLQDHNGKVRFRNLRVLEAPSGLGLDAWQAPEPASGPELVLDRLMNSERLAEDDGLTTHSISGQIEPEKSAEPTKFAGPGALVRFSCSDPKTKVSLYFDGETKPRIECTAQQLFERVPAIGEDRQPLLMCLPFAKSLRITQSASKSASTYRFDYVSFPSDTPVATFTTRDRSTPRGMLPALEYRFHQFGWGTHREADPYRRYDCQPKTIEPGSAAPLISVPATGGESAGTVEWLKLVADASVLENNDLWLEITVDGESTPALSAPARFLFPILRGGANHPNFVMTNRGGFTSLLAMPFGAGISIAAHNHGAGPIAKVGAALSVAPAATAEGEKPSKRARLRGVFQSGGNDGQLLNRAGAGRWVALVVGHHGKATALTCELVVDGEYAPSWALGGLDQLFNAPAGAKEFYGALNGRNDRLAWRYLLLEPVEFNRSIQLKTAPGEQLPDRLALFYIR